MMIQITFVAMANTVLNYLHIASIQVDSDPVRTPTITYLRVPEVVPIQYRNRNTLTNTELFNFSATQIQVIDLLTSDYHDLFKKQT